MAVIEVEGLYKSFGDQVVLDGVSLAMPEGLVQVVQGVRAAVLAALPAAHDIPGHKERSRLQLPFQ